MSKNHPLPKLYIEYEVKDKDGKILSKGKFKSQTWVGNIVRLLNQLLNLWATGSTLTTYVVDTPTVVKDTSNTARSFRLGSASQLTWGGKAPAGNTSAGILVGTSDAPVTIDQYNLQGLIAHGTGAGQLSYGDTTVEAMTEGTTFLFRVIRTFTNNSGASITVKEMGLFILLGYTIMLARDVPTGGITVPNGSTLTLRYIISHTIS